MPFKWSANEPWWIWFVSLNKNNEPNAAMEKKAISKVQDPPKTAAVRVICTKYRTEKGFAGPPETERTDVSNTISRSSIVATANLFFMLLVKKLDIKRVTPEVMITGL